MINDEMDFTNIQKLREKAEKKLNETRKTKNGELNTIDVNKLLHELQVHQIELEMQNEELQQAYKAAEKALKKYTTLFDFSPMGYFSLDSDGSICDLNFTGANMLEERRFSLINSNFKLFIADESKPIFNDFFGKLYVSNVRESCKVWLGYDNKILCQVYMEGIVLENEKNCFLSVVDISKFSNV
ncbi:hypothetical protein [Alkalitalea saponilacus]|uniref:PAS domain S-box-containing protein n=1 Tax=Alkalitalea saponilacus TaxID=889453 RepID=A0A1T5G8U7_9BACT|nr:hypothetical protein [Alkalitalea saponilacus]ASB47891.1 hypothetical protein CDL62_01360 [Alkalitalea saponilacus]SKC04795.1 hypothetical protein SAMN03080601_01772 [Alkalitalea saponilacus]